MSRKKLILLASDSMDDNKKPDRHEDGLIRMSSTVRKHMEFNDDSVEIYPAGGSLENRVSRTQMLEIFKAFAADLTKAKEELTNEELKRVGFVTSKTLRRINGGANRKSHKNIWISDTIEDTVMGSDPEFLLFDRDSNNVIRANNVLSRTGMLGSDGAMAEIRPKPAVGVNNIISNITNVFSKDKAIKEIERYRWEAACYHRDSSRDYPVGGHIHIGNPVKIAKLVKAPREAFFKVMNKILDELLAIPLTKLDGADQGNRRRTKCQMCTTGFGGYGFFGEMRVCNGRLEHRTLSGMWLLHPSVARAVFGTAKAIVEEVFKRVSDKKFDQDYMCLFPSNPRNSRHIWEKDFTGWSDIGLARDMKCTKTSDEMIKILNASSASYINTAYLNKWLSTMKGFSTYKKNSQYILGLYEILKISAAELQKWDKEIQNNWLKKKTFMVDV